MSAHKITLCTDQEPGRSLTKKKSSCAQFSQKSPRVHHVLAVGGWRLAVGDWRLVAVGGGWRPNPGGLGLVVGRCWRLAVGSWWRLAVGGGQWLVIDGPLGRSLRAVLNGKKI